MAISLVALACGLVAVGMGLVLLFADDDPAAPAASDVTASPTPADPTAAPTLQPTAPEVATLTVAGDVQLPAELALLVGHVPFGKGGIAAWDIQRHSQVLRGTTGAAAIGGPSPSDGPGLSFAQDESGVVFASICRPVACMSEGFDPNTAFTTTFYRSDDGGLTWREVVSRDGQWFVRAAVDGEPIAVNFGATTQWVFAVSNRAIARPAEAEELGLVVFRGKLAWLHRDLPVVIGETGGTLYKLDTGQPLTARIQSISAPAGSGGIAVLWADAGKRYLTIDTGRGEFFRTIEVGDAVHSVYGFASDSRTAPRLLVSGFTGARSNRCAEGTTGYGASPAILEPATAYMYFIRDLLVSEDCPAGGTVAFAFWNGPFARVTQTGSCLNLREEPSLDAPVEACLADTALLQIVDSRTNAEGTWWQAVVTPSGEDGWVAEEYLTRISGAP